MINFSTDELRPHERFDHWREVRGKKLFGVTIELERERRADFTGRFAAAAVGGATLARMDASAYQVSRTATDISRMPSDSLVIFEQVAGPGWCDTGRGDPFHVTGGELIAGHSDQPYACTPATVSHFRFRALSIPPDAETEFSGSARDLAIAPLDPGGDRYFRLIAAAFSALFDTGERLAEPEAKKAVGDLAQLLLLSRALARPGSWRSRNALRSGYVEAARQVMKRNLHRMNLSPETVAAALAISVRQVHLLFEPSGKSFMRSLATIRIEEACRLLREAPEQQVADIGFACGFHSLATFYRAFREVEGLAPTDYRRMMQERADH